MDDEERLFLELEMPRRYSKRCCVVGCLIFSVIFLIGIIFLTVSRANVKRTWRRFTSDTLDYVWFPETGSESCIRLLDIDEDGLDDVIVAVTEVTTISNHKTEDQNRTAFCRSLDVAMPCSGMMYGIRGYDFKILWSFRMKQSVFEIVCNTIDINGDGHNDCLAAGRQATLISFDPRNGNVFWRDDEIHSRNTTWNFYNPLVLSVDIDGDGVKDIVISHGGNPTIPPDVHVRDPGCLLIISGRTGRQIGKPFWMPDGKETYMSPVLYGKGTILFGSGGETVPGALYSISIENLLNNEDQQFTLFKSSEKGVMVPPLIIDVDENGVDDILVSCFDGTIQLIDGRTLYPLWTRQFHGYEFYTTPAPGDFNNDGYIDFMLILNHGEWDRYHWSQMIVLDGVNGETLWTRNSSFGEFTSPLTLQMKKTNAGWSRDAFIYRQRGQSTSASTSILLHGIGLQDGEITRNETMSMKSNNNCNAFNLNDTIVHIYLTDSNQTRLIAMIYPPLNINHRCSDFEPMERSGGALGDLNGDGRLETVDITTFITKITSHNLNEFVTHSVLTRLTIDLKQNDPQIVASHVHELTNRTINSKLIDQLTEIYPWPVQSTVEDDMEILSNQTWNAYLGRLGNSHEERRLN